MDTGHRTEGDKEHEKESVKAASVPPKPSATDANAEDAELGAQNPYSLQKIAFISRVKNQISP